MGADDSSLSAKRQENKMSSIKLTYFNGRGRAETIRMCLAVGGIEFDDKRVEQSDWPAMKESTQWGFLPMMEVDGVQVGQSIACARYAAKKAGLLGNTDTDQMIADSVVDGITEMQGKMYQVFFGETDENKKAFAECVKKTYPALEKILCANKGGDGFFVGDSLTWADLCFYQCLETMLSKQEDCLDTVPKMKALFKRIGDDPRVGAWLKKRPESQF